MIHSIINDLILLLKKITPEDYSKPLDVLSGASIGQHVRHSIEIYQCLINEYKNGTVNYSNRKRDTHIELDPLFAQMHLNQVLAATEIEDSIIYLIQGNEFFTSSFKRELCYCNEHLIHHMALIKVGVLHLDKYTVSENFGVAPSTIQYRQACAQ